MSLRRSERDEAALKRLSDTIKRAHPERVARVASDLAAEIGITEAQAQDLEGAGNATDALTATSIAAAITKIHQLLAGTPDTEGDEQ